MENAWFAFNFPPAKITIYRIFTLRHFPAPVFFRKKPQAWLQWANLIDLVSEDAVFGGFWDC